MTPTQEIDRMENWIEANAKLVKPLLKRHAISEALRLALLVSQARKAVLVYRLIVLKAVCVPKRQNYPYKTVRGFKGSQLKQAL